MTSRIPTMALAAALLICWPAAQSAHALSAPPEALRIIRRIPIQHNGRHKPFDSFARETLTQITGEPSWRREDPVVTVLSVIAEPDRWQQVPLVSVPFVPLREVLGMNPKAHAVSYNDLVATRTLMRRLPPIIQKQQRDEKLTPLENETLDAFQRFVTLSELLEQKLEFVPPPPGSGTASWLGVLAPEGYTAAQQQAVHGAWTEWLAALRGTSSEAVTAASGRLQRTLSALNPSAQIPAWRIALEIFYNHAKPFHWARALYLLALLGLIWSLTVTAPRMASAGFAALAAAYLCHAAGILMRVLIGGRPPVSNFFESMLWLPFVAVTASLVFERVYRAKYFGMAGALLGALMLWLTDYVPLDSSISPVAAVLHSNLWLTIHVLTIVASYGALALAVALAHIYAWLYLMQGRADALRGLGLFIYRALQVGVVLLAGGIMLGAVWANASWGRYWGWDPKETWSLITLLWYLALLHGRFAGWVRGVGLALGTIGGFFLLLMTYYGVSFYLVGLHSYAGGHAKPLPVLLIAYLIAESAFLASVGLAALRRRAT